MCLFVNATAKEQTAKEDITVYKAIRSDNISYFQDFQYEPNTLYRLKKKLKVKKNGCGSDIIDKGFHSYKEYPDTVTLKVVEFVIPKGAKYYTGMWHGEECYVSSSIHSGTLRAIR